MVIKKLLNSLAQSGLQIKICFTLSVDYFRWLLQKMKYFFNDRVKKQSDLTTLLCSRESPGFDTFLQVSRLSPGITYRLQKNNL